MRWLLLKDLQILRRSPFLIALLIGLALSKGPDKPRVAILNQLPQGGGQVRFAGTRVDPRDFEAAFVRFLHERGH